VGESSGLVTCDIWISDPSAIQSVTVRQRAGGQEQEVSFTPYDTASQPAAWLILVDKSNSARQATVTKIKQEITKIISAAGNNHRLGLASFAGKLDIIAPIGSSSIKLKLAADRLKAEGTVTELFRVAEEGIDALRSYQAGRKALVIFSDGKAEDTSAFPLERVVKRAREAGVVIYGVGYPESASDATSLQTLRRLASDTGGPFVSAILPDKTLPQDFITNFYRYLETGGTITFNSGAAGSAGGTVAYTIRALVDGNKSINGNAEVVFLANPMSDPVGWVEQQYEENATAVIVSALVSFLLLAGLIFLVVRQARRRKPEQIETAAEATGETEPQKQRLVLAWLEFLEEEGRRIAINETTVRIGRHSDNDIRIDEDMDKSTVHRRHATIHVTPDREFIITDLSGKDGNGVFVNSVRIERRELNDGDLIELGLVKLRFQIADI